VKKIGMANLIENARLLASATREASKELGLEVFAKRPGSSVTAVKAPAGMDSKVIVKGFKENFGAIIANGQGTMQGQIFRIAHLGYFDFADMFGIVAGLELILRANGHKVELGKGVAAVQRVYEAAKAQPKTASA
jgi:aspartate aminotransferase-like enzyme